MRRREIVVASAGLRVLKPEGPPEGAVLAARTLGVSLEGHVAQPLSPALVSGFDLLVVMEAPQATAIRRLYPNTASRTALLPRFDPNLKTLGSFERYNIPDPYGTNRESFEECYRRIKACLDGLLSRQGIAD
jgi:protein-tyrosine phosphatase